MVTAGDGSVGEATVTGVSSTAIVTSSYVRDLFLRCLRPQRCAVRSTWVTQSHGR